TNSTYERFAINMFFRCSGLDCRGISVAPISFSKHPHMRHQHLIRRSVRGLWNSDSGRQAMENNGKPTGDHSNGELSFDLRPKSCRASSCRTMSGSPKSQPEQKTFP